MNIEYAVSLVVMLTAAGMFVGTMFGTRAKQGEPK